MEEERGIAVLGATGSIGTQALEVIRDLRGQGLNYRVVVLAARSRVEPLVELAREFGAEVVVFEEPRAASRAQRLLPQGVRVLQGQEGLEEAVAHPGVEMVLNAVVGAAGLRATLAALRAGKRVALANKESLVIGGHLVQGLSRPGWLLPVDSEHSALWQALQGTEAGEVEKVWITASGGAFRDRDPAELSRVTPQEALAHPTWRMGPRITVDSATLVNKAFEVIEARWLFDLPFSRIGVLLHPQSVIHALVELVDGNWIGVLSAPDMRIPIKYALTYPRRLPPPPRPFHLAGMDLSFRELPRERYPAFEIALRAGMEGGTAPAVVNAADEVLVQAFLEGEIPFTAITEGLGTVLGRHTPVPDPTLEEVLEADAWAREETRRWLGRARRLKSG